MLNGHGTAPKVVVGGLLGQVCLTGDAAFVPWLHAAASMANALALADCLTETKRDVVEALRWWEPAQLDYGEQLRLGDALRSPGPTGLNKSYLVLPE